LIIQMTTDAGQDTINCI